MEIISTAAHAPKSPQPESDTPTRIQPGKAITPFPNGVLKRHRQHVAPPAAVVVTYRECLKNHAASLGGHALDGCGEFMPSPSATAAESTSLKCAACGCHRNFHRRDPDDSPVPLPPPPSAATHAIEYHPHHRHHPSPPRSPSSASPPPIFSSYAPHMLLALSSSLPSAPEIPPPPPHATAMISPSRSSRKRFRTKFSQTQKERMLEFAERVGWKIQRSNEGIIQEFCSEVGIDRKVLKVWMHNNKTTFARRESDIPNTTNGSGSSGICLGGENHSSNLHLGANGSSSS